MHMHMRKIMYVLEVYVNVHASVENVIGWFGVVFGINSTRNAARKGSSTRLCLELFYSLPGCITRAINPKYHTKPSYYIQE